MNKRYFWWILLPTNGAIFFLFKENWYVILAGVLGLIIYGLVRFYEYVHASNSLTRVFKIISLSTVIVFSLLFGAIDRLYPVIFKKEDFSTSQGNVYITDAGNLYFKTALDIERPLNLRKKDTYIHLVHRTDYDVLGKRTIYINYPFYDDYLESVKQAEKGLTFSYESRVSRRSPEYAKYSQEQKELKEKASQLNFKQVEIYPM